MGKIKKPDIKKAEKLKTPLLIDNFPAFTFKYIVNNNHYNLESSSATQELKCKVLHKLHNYSKRQWTEFIGNKQSTGVEIIDLCKLKKCKVSLPNNQFYNDIKNVVIFRVSDSARIVGHRIHNICYILWIDWDFTSYDHGS